MQKSSIKKLSILGVVLVAASAVTAAVLPNNSKDNSPIANTDVLEDSTGGLGGQRSCVEGPGFDCDATAQSSETVGSGTSTQGTNFTASSGNTTGE